MASTFSWSHSRWSLFNKCRAAYDYQYNQKLPRAENKYASRGKEIHAQIETFLKDSTLLAAPVAHPQIIAAKALPAGLTEFAIYLDRDWKLVDTAEAAWLKAILDFLAVDTVMGRIKDWKTGKEYPEHVDQAEIYALSVLCAYPELSGAEVVHVYVDSGRDVTRTYGRSDVPRLQDKWHVRAGEMETSTFYFPNPQYLCRYCAYSKASAGPCKF